ncbi:MAG: metallophosphoesterase [Gammaproteobacteria bacterium]|uniref:metallophosphoesterase n=1 Tax=Rhodoferax sp. TaxID=50421 RepID=UPI0017FAE957|nr:metallophosphoesterase [Rhodoferax sp.]MBU3900259.1 metallophosphoesterase [Gammaproteobacteria bacterium]MBA3057908.1 metallophosphoesterase [Rhodoferax sp.]MBU3997955.1 metallophosphoesterase [Gammaproteobacteria bacterium]MBU4079403.1 metallophosphoesterase [Gammaproteobacteria bacterium]MBU4111693.1 metallophosphoesterase [Gammaproteobacteria bacterium]
MRLQLISDLHLERCPDFVATPAPNVDVLVLAGDIGSYQAGSHLADTDFGLARFSPLQPDAPWPRVLYVPGNHEYDALDYAQTYARLRTICERLGITWLEHEVLELGKVRFIGSTLWSDFDAFAGAEVNLTRQLQLRQKAYRAADYYLRKNTTLRGGVPMLAQDIRELSLAAQDWLGQALRQPFDGSTVVVTHFAPSLRSADARYGLSPGTAGFCNALDELLTYAQLWLHGHLHCGNDYVVQGKTEGRDFACRVVANPLGYASKNEQLSYRPELVIELA